MKGLLMIKERIKGVKPRTWLIWGQAVLLVLLCLVHALSAGLHADFYPINGTFQNYNPVRRLLDGQAPYQDFQDYLGPGHLYTGALFTVLFGGNYTSSLIAFSFVSIGSMALICLVLGRAVLGRWDMALAVSCCVLLLLLVQPAFFTSGLAWCRDVYDALNYPLTVGNSARFVRGLVLPLAVALFWAGSRALEKVLEKRPSLQSGRKEISACLCGFLGGACFVWSNDFGICCWLSLFILTFCVAWRRSGKFLSALLDGLLYFLFSLIAVGLVAVIITGGHPSWWYASIAGTGGFQGWYFNTSVKSYYLFNIDWSFPVILQGFTALTYLILLLVKKAAPQALTRYGVPAFLNMAGFAAANAYKLVSSGTSRQVALACLFATLFFEGVLLLARASAALKNRTVLVHTAAAVLCGAWLVSAGMEWASGWVQARGEGVPFPQLGGTVTTYGEDLAAASEFLQGEPFFSTYASAQEVVEGKFQPSGVDYIIHALGDQAREEYLDAFHSGDFTYAATIREEFSGWAHWEMRADWYLHRELYKSWRPVFANTYEMYWARGNSNDPDVKLPQAEVEDVNGSTKKLVIRTDSSVNGIADVYLSYQVEKAPGLFSLLTFQPMLRVSNSGTSYATSNNDGHAPFDSNNLRPSGGEYIPVIVTDGYGEVTLTANPQRNCLLFVNEARCDGLYTSAFDYVPVKFERQEEDRTVLRADAPIRYLERYVQCLKGGTGLELDGESYPMEGFLFEGAGDEDSMGSVFLTVEGDITPEMLKGQNVARVIRE